jgi:NADH-quinone oxidoreductase subunit I
VEACPTEAITESKLFEFSFTNRNDAVYTKAELMVDDDGLPKRLPWEDWSDIEAVAPLTSAWMRATSSNGSAAYEGRVQWSGELGFGVRPPEQGQSVPESETDTSEADAIFSHPGEPGGHAADDAPGEHGDDQT